MKRMFRATAIVVALILPGFCSIDVFGQGTAFTYQGRITDNGTNFDGTGQFEFALVTCTNNTYTTFWSNDGTSVNGGQPSSAVSIEVTNGLFTVILGDTALQNMTSIPRGIFATEPNLQLLIWFNDGVSGFAELNPPQPLTSVPAATYANCASNLLGTLPATQLTGTVPLAQLPAAVVTNNGTVNVTLDNLTLNGTLTLPPTPLTIDSGTGLLMRADNNENFFAGFNAGNPTTTGSGNVADGYEALQSNTSGNDNTAEGVQALYLNTSGNENTADGFDTLLNLAAGTNNIALGYNAGSAFTNNESGNIDIGNIGVAGENNIIRIGTSGVHTATYLSGTVYANTVALTSDRNAKENFTSISPQAVLDKVISLPVTEWNYKLDKSAEHIGPMAQDFHAAFGLDGADDKHISVVDEGGVALSAIQGLNEKLDAVSAENEKLKQENILLTRRLDALEAQLKALPQKKQ